MKDFSDVEHLVLARAVNFVFLVYLLFAFFCAVFKDNETCPWTISPRERLGARLCGNGVRPGGRVAQSSQWWRWPCGLCGLGKFLKLSVLLSLHV